MAIHFKADFFDHIHRDSQKVNVEGHLAIIATRLGVRNLDRHQGPLVGFWRTSFSGFGLGNDSITRNSVYQSYMVICGAPLGNRSAR